MRLYHKPLVLLIWLGAVVMALGGALSLSDRRLRIGAPKPAAGSCRSLRNDIVSGRGGRLATASCNVKDSNDLGARFVIVLVALLGATPLHAVRGRRNSPDRRLESARPRDIARAALHGVPEPVDRRLRGAAGARSAAAGARAAQGRRQRPQVLDFMVARYGEFVLLKPRMSWRTAILWGAPLAILIAGLLAIGFSVLRRPGSASSEIAALTDAERLKLQAIKQSQADGAR